MGFYGNITNTARTQFQFDRVYPNRYEMEQKTNIDGVYAGRYCLIEYDSETHTDTMQRVWIFDGDFYTVNKKDHTALLTKGTTAAGTVVFTANTSENPADNIYDIKICQFYVCTSELATKDEDKDKPAEFMTIVNGANSPAYTINYTIDTEAFKISRGYDSTVWQKVYTESTEKYVMIAELNTVVPTFEVSPDAPTMSPIVPHFDTRSTDVYYKLHWQAPWGFRVAAAGDVAQSDAVTSWVKYKYNVDAGITVPQCYDPLHEKADEDGWRDQTEAEQKNPVLLPKHDAAVYFNRAAFDPKDTSVKRISEYRAEDNVIKIAPTGISGQEYNAHNGSFDKVALPDTQELTIHLPEIGNMMSDAWDIIHGPNRDDDMREFDENGDRVDSLQGRLNSIAAINVDEIPIKRDSDGKLIGSKINGGRDSDQDDDLTGVQDDAWIETIVDSNNKKISIHHTFNQTKNGNTFTDLRVDKNHTHDTTDSIDMNEEEGDSFNIVTPIVDAMGHVVGKNAQTITLPNGVYMMYTDGVSTNMSDIYTEFVNDDTMEPEEWHSKVEDVNPSFVTADNSKDTFTLNPYNKWIQIQMPEENEVIGSENNAIKIAHEIHYINELDKEATDLNAPAIDTITLQDIVFDRAGHVKENRNHTYTLPYGFKTIKVENTNEVDEPKSTVSSNHTVADNTQDTLTIAASNHWIKLDNSEDDTIYIGHASPVLDDVDSIGYQEEDITDLRFGDSFTLPYIFVDSKGHVANSGTYDIVIPKGAFEDKKISNSTANALTGITFDAPTGKISVTHDNAGNLLLSGLSAVNSDAAWVQSTDSINSAFKKVDTRLDAEITRASKAEDDLNKRIDDLDYTDTSNEGQVVYSIAQADGAVSAEHKNVGELLMSGYVKPTTLANQSLVATETLNTALGKLEYRLEDEVKARADAITKEISDRNTAIDNAINALDVSDTADATKYVSAVSESNGKITVSRASLPTLSSGSANGTVKLSNGNDVAVTGLGSAAYTNSDGYATADQGAKADTALQRDTLFSTTGQAPQDGDNAATISEMFAMIIELQNQVEQLQQEVSILQQHHENPDEGTVE